MNSKKSVNLDLIYFEKINTPLSKLIFKLLIIFSIILLIEYLIFPKFIFYLLSFVTLFAFLGFFFISIIIYLWGNMKIELSNTFILLSYSSPFTLKPTINELIFKPRKNSTYNYNASCKISINNISYVKEVLDTDEFNKIMTFSKPNLIGNIQGNFSTNLFTKFFSKNNGGNPMVSFIKSKDSKIIKLGINKLCLNNWYLNSTIPIESCELYISSNHPKELIEKINILKKK